MGGEAKGKKQVQVGYKKKQYICSAREQDKNMKCRVQYYNVYSVYSVYFYSVYMYSVPVKTYRVHSSLDSYWLGRVSTYVGLVSGES